MTFVLFLLSWCVVGAAAASGSRGAQGLFVIFLIVYLAWCVAVMAADFKERL